MTEGLKREGELNKVEGEVRGEKEGREVEDVGTRGNRVIGEVGECSTINVFRRLVYFNVSNADSIVNRNHTSYHKYTFDLHPQNSLTSY